MIVQDPESDMVYDDDDDDDDDVIVTQVVDYGSESESDENDSVKETSGDQSDSDSDLYQRITKHNQLIVVQSSDDDERGKEPSSDISEPFVTAVQLSADVDTQQRQTIDAQRNADPHQKDDWSETECHALIAAVKKHGVSEDCMQKILNDPDYSSILRKYTFDTLFGKVYSLIEQDQEFEETLSGAAPNNVQTQVQTSVKDVKFNNSRDKMLHLIPKIDSLEDKVESVAQQIEVIAHSLDQNRENYDSNVPFNSRLRTLTREYNNAIEMELSKVRSSNLSRNVQSCIKTRSKVIDIDRISESDKRIQLNWMSTQGCTSVINMLHEYSKQCVGNDHGKSYDALDLRLDRVIALAKGETLPNDFSQVEKDPKCHTIPFVSRLPLSVTWLPANRNFKCAHPLRKKVLYADESGEMVPASDDEDEEHLSTDKFSLLSSERKNSKCLLDNTIAKYNNTNDTNSSGTDGTRDFPLVANEDTKESHDEQKIKIVKLMEVAGQFSEKDRYIMDGIRAEFGTSDSVIVKLAQWLKKSEKGVAEYVKLKNEVTGSKHFKEKTLRTCSKYKVVPYISSSINGDLRGYPVDEDEDDNLNPFDMILLVDFEDALDSFQSLYCRRCYRFDCQLHGLSVPRKREASCEIDNDKPQTIEEVIQGASACGPSCCRLSSRFFSILHRVTRTKEYRAHFHHAFNVLGIESSTMGVYEAQSSEFGIRSIEEILEVSSEEQKKFKHYIISALTHDFTIESKSLGLLANSFKEEFEDPNDSIKAIDRDNDCSYSINDALCNIISDDFSQIMYHTSLYALLVVQNQKGSNISKSLLQIRPEWNRAFSPEQSNGWMTSEVQLYKIGRSLHGTKCCTLTSSIYSKTCSEVANLLLLDVVRQGIVSEPIETSVEKDDGLDNQNTDTSPTKRGRSKQKRRDINRSITHNVSNMMKRRNEMLVSEYNKQRKTYETVDASQYPKDRSLQLSAGIFNAIQYEPCECDECGEDCPCYIAGSFCEKHCACSKNKTNTLCKMRFPGCKCKRRCNTRTCPCFASGRECDPDMCHRQCDETQKNVEEASNISNIKYRVKDVKGGCNIKGRHRFKLSDALSCQNMNLRLNNHKPVKLGKSKVDGWGVFAVESINKNDFIGEYVGEIISQAEADRRGKSYDRLDSSFLFNLNNEWVIDASVKGNKLKFANHSSDPNCRTRATVVDGEHRVGIYANKYIAAGAELFYDYRYDIHNAPSWAKESAERAAAFAEISPLKKKAKK